MWRRGCGGVRVSEALERLEGSDCWPSVVVDLETGAVLLRVGVGSGQVELRPGGGQPDPGQESFVEVGGLLCSVGRQV